MELLHRPVIPFDHHEIQKLIDRLPPKYRDWVGAWEEDDWSLVVGRWSPCRYAAELWLTPHKRRCVACKVSVGRIEKTARGCGSLVVWSAQTEPDLIPSGAVLCGSMRFIASANKGRQSPR